VKTLRILANTGNSRILIGETLGNVLEYIPPGEAVIVTDTNVSNLYKNQFPPCEVIEIETGEGIKTLDTVRDIYGRLVEMEVDRSSFIIGIGGGIVCDITGFAASTFLRGLEFGFVSTTLLSQVDASVGGKNGVNFDGYKNMVGVFNQPQFVLCDLDLLKTLPEREILCGLGEVAKHAFLGDARLFTYLEEHHEQAVALDPEVIERLVYDSVVLKADIVNRDEKEKGERRKLNFGHTFGHALEIQTDFNHGEAVSVGMMIAGFLSAGKGYLGMKDVERIGRLLGNLHLPTRPPVEPEGILRALRKDKKRKGNNIHFVLLREIGNFVLLREIGTAVVEEISLDELEVELNAFYAWDRSRH